MVDIIFSIAAILISMSYLATNMLLLRIISIIGAGVYVVGGLIAGYQASGMKALIFFSLINLLINLVQSIKLVLDHIPLLLPDDLHAIYSNTFNNMTTNEFMKIYKLSSTKSIMKNEYLIRQNEPVSHLMMIKSGLVNIIKNGHPIAKLSKGFFLGEMSYLTEGLANASAQVASDKVDYIDWDKKILAKMKVKNPGLYIKLKQAISLDLIKKIDQHLEADITK